MSFEEWCVELCRLAKGHDSYPGTDPITQCGADSWREFYDDGYSPNEALIEDYSYWHDEV